MTVEKPHILILPRWYPNHNDVQLGNFIQEQAKLISEIYTISVIYVQPSNTTKNYFVKHQINHNINEIIIEFKSPKYFKKIIHFIRYRKAQKIGLKLIDKKIDLSHVHVPIRPAFLALQLLRQKKVPFIITEHWSGHLNGLFIKKNSFYKFAYQSILKKAKSITTVSSVLQNKFKNNTGFNSKRIPNYIQTVKKQHELVNNSIIKILSVSDLYNSTKNVNGLIDAFSQALKANPNLHLDIIGDGPDNDNIKTKIKNLNIEDKITLLGRKPHSSVLQYYSKYNFYICNSNVETFGMTVAEALLSGLPVISTKCGGPEEFVNESNGILIPINSENSMINAILHMSDVFQQYDSTTISNAIDKVYGKQAVQQKWINLYNSILHE